MDDLIRLDSVTSDHHLQDLQKLYDNVEMRLQSLGIRSDTYSSLLALVLICVYSGRRSGRCFNCICRGHVSNITLPSAAPLGTTANLLDLTPTSDIYQCLHQPLPNSAPPDCQSFDLPPQSQQPFTRGLQHRESEILPLWACQEPAALDIMWGSLFYCYIQINKCSKVCSIVNVCLTLKGYRRMWFCMWSQPLWSIGRAAYF